MSFLLLPRSCRVAPKCRSDPLGRSNAGTRFPKSQFWASKMITILALRTNIQKPASLHTFQQRSLAKLKPNNQNPTPQQNQQKLKQCKIAPMAVAMQQWMPTKLWRLTSWNQRASTYSTERITKLKIKQQKPNKPASRSEYCQASRPATRKPATAKGAGGRGEALR